MNGLSYKFFRKFNGQGAILVISDNIFYFRVEFLLQLDNLSKPSNMKPQFFSSFIRILLTRCKLHTHLFTNFPRV